MYSPELLDHFYNPRNVGDLPEADATGESSFPTCGDTMRLMLCTEDDRVVAARWLACGCGAVLAACSAGTELISGLSVEEARRLDSFAINRALGGVPPSKRHALWMFLECLAQALGPRPDTDHPHKEESE